MDLRCSSATGSPLPANTTVKMMVTMTLMTVMMMMTVNNDVGKTLLHSQHRHNPSHPYRSEADEDDPPDSLESRSLRL